MRHHPQETQETSTEKKLLFNSTTHRVLGAQKLHQEGKDKAQEVALSGVTGYGEMVYFILDNKRHW